MSNDQLSLRRLVDLRFDAMEKVEDAKRELAMANVAVTDYIIEKKLFQYLIVDWRKIDRLRYVNDKRGR